MFALRAPTKKQPNEDRTPPSSPGDNSVRLSFGEWEAAGTTATSSTARAGPARQPQPTLSQKQNPKTKTSDKTITRTPTSPKRWPEARACLSKGKLNLENSRNLKTEIKMGVMEALDRLYALVKEAEAELQKGKPTSEPG